jgi:mannobiose 2-epimerase
LPTPTFSNHDLALQLEAELTGNILPFWMKYLPDRVNGGFYGAVSNNLEVNNDVPRSAILCTRILWTFSAAYRKYKAAEYLEMAQWAYDYLTKVFWDKEYEGVFWSVDRNGKPVLSRKHHYAQAFTIYALSEYYQATQSPESLSLAQQLFSLLESHGFDPLFGGYIEGSSREWEALEDMRLAEDEPACRKSMNTMLHMLEAYTNLLRIWDDPRLKSQHRSLLETFEKQVINHASGHLKLFFNDDWSSLPGIDSYGHDIEASWLMWEAAQMHDDPSLSSQIRESSLQLAEAVYEDGLDADGSVFNAGNAQGVTDDSKAWWPQTEGMVGFYNAFQLSGKEYFLEAALDCWRFIQAHMIDRVNGDWFKQTDRAGIPDPTHLKAGFWDCPYHHSRACLILIEELAG